MARYSPSTSGLEPGKRVGAGPSSKVALAARPERSFILLYVDHETAAVHVALSETASLNAPAVVKSNGLVQLVGYTGALSVITSTEGPNEKQKVAIENAAEGTFTLAFEGKTTGAIEYNAPAAEGSDEVQKVTLANAEGGTFTLAFGAKTSVAIASNATKEAVEEALEALTTIGEGNVKVEGEAGGPYTITFIGTLAKQNVAALVADGTELEGAEAEVTVVTETEGIESVAEKLEALTTVGEGNVTVTGEAGGPYTVEFVEGLKATDVAQMTADGSKLVAEEEKEASVTVTTETPGGVAVLVAEG